MNRRWIGLVMLAALGMRLQAAFPTITSISPTAGAPGNIVTIFGTDFGFITRVVVGNSDALIVQRTPLQVVVPLNATTGPIYVYNATGFDDSDQTFQVAPRVTGFSPAATTPGSLEQVTISGINLSNPGFDPPTDVWFNGVLSPSVFVSSDTAIIAQVPFQTATGPITVQTLAGFITTKTNFFLPPLISHLDPARAAIGAKLKIIGVSMTGVDTVVFAGGVTATPVVQSPTNVLVTVPEGALDGPLYVQNPAFISSGVMFGLLPKIVGIDPNHGPAGTIITLQGSGLGGVKSVQLGGVAATIASNETTTAVFVVVPAGAQTGPARVITASGTNTSEALFYASPSITSFTPVRGEVGTSVIIKGINLLGATNVLFGTSDASPLAVTNAQLTAIVPANAATGKLIVFTPAGAVTSAIPFQVIGPEPQISGFNPEFGLPGALVQVFGQNFLGATSVSFGGTPSTPTILSDTNLTVKVPAGARTGPIRVSNAKGVGTSALNFVVGDQADLRLTIPQPTGNIGVGDDLTVRVSAANAGPLTVSPTTSLTWSGPVTYQSAETLNGVFDRLGNSGSWDLGTFADGASGLLTLHFRVNGPGLVRVTGEIHSDFPDNSPGNNSAELSLSIGVPRVSVGRAADGRIRLSWPKSSSGFVLEETPVLSPPQWTPVGKAPSSNATEIFVELEPGGNAAYFRLRSD